MVRWVEHFEFLLNQLSTHHSSILKGLMSVVSGKTRALWTWFSELDSKKKSVMNTIRTISQHLSIYPKPTVNWELLWDIGIKFGCSMMGWWLVWPQRQDLVPFNVCTSVLVPVFFNIFFSPVSQSFSMTSWKAVEGTLEIYGWMEIFLITKGSRQPQRPQQCRSLSCTMLIAVYLWLTPQKISNTTKTVVICQWVSISPPTIPVLL